MKRKTYFILAKLAGLVKIGQSDNPEERLLNLQVGSPETLELLLVLDHKSPFEEQQLHFRFRCFRHHGEWFEFRNEVRLCDREVVESQPDS